MRILFAALLAIAAVGTAGAEEPKLQPHRAVYTIRIVDSSASTGLTGGEGVMALELRSACDGWTTRQRLTFDMFDSDGENSRHDVSFSSFESRDRASYHFSQRSFDGDQLTEELRGGATMPAKGAGNAEFALPEPRRVELPDGTMFPTAYNQSLIREAIAGKRHLVDHLFIGQRDDEPMLVSSFVSPLPPKRATTHQVRFGANSNDLLAGRAWRFHLAHYTAGDAMTPGFEVVETMHDNGIVESARVNFPDFAFVYTLDRLERLPSPRC